MSAVLWVALGGAIGSVARYGVNVAGVRAFGLGFTWGTLAVNVLGSLAIGFVTAMLLRRWPEASDLKFFLSTGLLGGFTTFSAFSLEAAQLLERGAFALMGFYVGGTVLLSLLAVFVGLAVGRGLGA